MSGRQLPIVLALGTTQTLAWASSYYLLSDDNFFDVAQVAADITSVEFSL